MYLPPAWFDRRVPSRRSVLQGLAATLAAAMVSPRAAFAAGPEPREVAFVHTHTHERLSVTYFADGSYDDESLAALNWFLRDHRTGDEHPIDPALFDILHELRLATGAASPYQVISGYRSLARTACCASTVPASRRAACTCRGAPSMSGLPT